MRRQRIAVVCALGAIASGALATAPATSAAADSTTAHAAISCGASAGEGEPVMFDYWCGRWQVDFGPLGGPFGSGTACCLAFQRISQTEGQAAVGKDFGVFPFNLGDCQAPTLYYRARFDWGHGGDMVVCTTHSGLGLQGRYRLDNLQDSTCCGIVQSGDVDFTGGGFPRQFSLGDYSVDDSGTGSFHWTGHYLGGGVPDPRRFSLHFAFTQHGHPDHRPATNTQIGGAGTVTFGKEPGPNHVTNGQPSAGTKLFYFERTPGSPRRSITLRPGAASYDPTVSHLVVLRLFSTVVKSDDPRCRRGARVGVVLAKGTGGEPDSLHVLGSRNCSLKEGFTGSAGSRGTHRLSISISTPSQA